MNTGSRSIPALVAALLSITGATFAQTPASSVPLRMRAIVYHEYGSPDVLRLEEIETPVPNDDQVLIRVRAAAVNPFDLHFMRGSPYFMRVMGVGFSKPVVEQLGVDFSGTVAAVGKNVTQFKLGDEVFGGRTGAFAEYICVGEDRVVSKPADVTFEQAATLPIAAITALQALRDGANVQPGQKVLINGASGGVGTFAVQIAKSFGAEVTGVCSTRNVDLVRSIGADHVVDYTREDFTESVQRYDVMLDCVGNRSLLACRRMLNPRGKYLMIGGRPGNWIRPMDGVLKTAVLALFVQQDVRFFMANMNKADLGTLGDLLQSGKVTPVIDRRYRLSEVAEAMRYLEEGHARGKVVITVGPDDASSPVSAAPSESFMNMLKPYVAVFAFIGIAIGLPLVLALRLNRRAQRRSPNRTPFRWGYYFSLQSFVAGICLGIVLESGVAIALTCILIYATLAWFFAQRRHWAWIALTLLSFNPVVWIINSVYLWKRWAEVPRTAD